jgi:hypothetical protein
MLNYLRIAVTAICFSACVLLVALWVRSYWWTDIVTWGLANGPGYMFGSSSGELSAARFRSRDGAVSLGWHAWTNPADGKRAWSTSKSSNFIGIRYGTFFTAIPQWFVVTACAAAASAPWMRWRFRLRTLLIATTLVAVGLGLIVLL